MSSADKKNRTRIQAVKGTVDIMPSDAIKFQHVEKTARKVLACYGYSEIRTPILEATELFARSAGEASDVVVSKQMYTFDDAGGRSNTMRPEGTAGVVRAMVEHGEFKKLPIHKLYYGGPMFRYEQPQKGRQRQFHQLGVEYFGISHPAADVDVIALCDQLLKELGFENIVTRVNTIGCPDCRAAYNEKLREVIQAEPDGWCEQCRERARINPMRVFDCKVDKCSERVKSLPRVNESVCQPCRTHFERVVELLDAAGIAHEPDNNLVRGFDYYTRTVFEVMQGNIGAQSAILGGGRYDNLVEELGGPPTPAVGMGIGMERLLLAMEANGISFPPPTKPDYYALAMDEASVPQMTTVVAQIRRGGMSVIYDCQPRNIGAGLKAANRANAQFLLVLGETEREKGIIARKDLQSGVQDEVPLKNYLENVK